MAYTKTNWKDGDVISAERMNKIEKGIEDAWSSGGSEDIIIPFTYNAYIDEWTMGSSYAEMQQAMDEGKALRFNISITNGNKLDANRIIIGNNGYIHYDSDTLSFYTELFTYTTIQSNSQYSGNTGCSGYITITDNGIDFNDVNIGLPYAVAIYYDANGFVTVSESSLARYNIMNAYALNIPLVVRRTLNDTNQYYVFNPYGFVSSLVYFKGPNVKAASSTNLMPTDEIIIALNKETGIITELS